jgi:ABC-type bacteriocin/lantibiotic exporter with double-glycine peptidase domain
MTAHQKAFRQRTSQEQQRAIEGLASVLGAAAQRLNVRVDSLACHRAARGSYEADAAEGWEVCVAQAAKAVGLVASPCYLTEAEVIRCLAGRAVLATWRHASQQWLLVVDRLHNQTIAVGEDGTERRLKLANLYIEETSYGNQEMLWCVLEPQLPFFAGMPSAHSAAGLTHAGSHSPDRHSEISPLRRLIGLLRHDHADLWTVVVFAILVGLLGLAVPIAAELLFSTVAFGNLLQPVVVLTAILGGALTFSAVLQSAQIYVVELMQRRLFVRLAAELTVRLRSVDMKVWDEHQGSELVNRFFDILTVQKVGASLLLDALSLIILALVSMIVLAFYHPFLLGFDLVLIAGIVLILFVMGHGAVASSIAESRSKYAVVAWLEEMTRHPLAFKLAGGGEFSWRRSESLIKEYLANRESHFHILFRQISFSLGLQALATTALLGIGGWLVIERTLTLGQLVAAQLLVANIVTACAKLGKHIEGYYDLMAATDKLGHLLDLPMEETGGEIDAGMAAPIHLQIKHLSFAYRPGRPVLEDVDLTILPGEAVALRGAAARGKSALVDLIHGLRMPTQGMIQIDGQNILDFKRETIRDRITTVRDIEVFEGTIAENVTLDRPTVTITDLQRALQVVGLGEEVASLPQGLRTAILPGGAPLSESQALRLTLARAIAGRPGLLILDESLDRFTPELRGSILESLLSRPRPWSVLIVTNLDDLAQRCDRSIDLDTARRRDDA